MDLLNNNDKRHLKIIEILTYSNRDYTVKEITGLLKISERTLYRDIISINESYDYVKIEFNDVLSIEYSKNHSINNVYEDVIRDQAIFNLIEKITYQDDLNITYLSAILGVSVPTMYKNISQFNTYIHKRYNFKIETSPCRFVGEEKDIRAFLSQYFVEANGLYTWPFEKVDEDEIEELLTIFFTSFGCGSDYSTHMNIKIIVALNILFYSRGREIKEIQKEDYILEIAKDAVEHIQQNPSLVKMFQRFNIEIGVDEIIQVAYPFMSDGILPGDILLLQRNIPEEHIKKLEKIKDFIGSVEKYVDLEEEAKNPLTLRVYNGLVLGYYGLFADYILFEKGRKFYHSMKDMTPKVMGLIDKKLRELYPLFHIKPTEAFHRHMSNILVMNWPNFMPQLLGTDVTSKVLIVSDLGKGHAEMYKFRFKSELVSFLTVDVYDRQTLSIDWINENGYSYIISNCDLKGIKEDTNLMVISTCPTSRDFDLIRSTFSEERGVKNLCAGSGNEKM